MLDIKGAFLHGQWTETQESVYMKVPQGMEHHYTAGVGLLLMRTLYGSINIAKAFWKEHLRCMKDIELTRNPIDPCVYQKGRKEDALLWSFWIDDLLLMRPNTQVAHVAQEMLRRVKCDDVGEPQEYLGRKITKLQDGQAYRLTQPVLIQSFIDEFDWPYDPQQKGPTTPLIPHKSLQHPDYMQTALLDE